jgi:hypothetical protein
VNDRLPLCRVLRPEELAVVGVLLDWLDETQYQQLSGPLVRDKADGTMGITFIRPDDGKAAFFKEIASADFVDDDGKKVSIALHVDRAGRIMELDFVKADLSPVCKFPTPELIQVKLLPMVIRDAASRWQTLFKLWRKARRSM